MARKSDEDAAAFATLLRELFADAKENIVPQMMRSAFVIGAMSEEPDLALALQIGLSLMLDKPLVLLAPPGLWLAPRLRALADTVVVGDLKEPGVRERLMTAIQKIIDKRTQ